MRTYNDDIDNVSKATNAQEDKHWYYIDDNDCVCMTDVYKEGYYSTLEECLEHSKLT